MCIPLSKSVVKYTRAEKQASGKQTFGFRRDSEQTVCRADKEQEVRVCERKKREQKSKRLGSRHLVFAGIASKRSAEQTKSRKCGFAGG